MKSDTAYSNLNQERTTGMKNDSNMLLTLMLKQLENQDPTEPTDNTEWLSQLAQYSSLEQMSQMNSGLENCAKYISAMYDDMMLNSEINKTLSMIGKDVTLKIPGESDPTKFVRFVTIEDLTVKIDASAYDKKIAEYDDLLQNHIVPDTCKNYLCFILAILGPP